MSGASGSTGTTERFSPPCEQHMQKCRPHGAAFSLLYALLRSTLTRRASQQLGHLFLQSVQGIGGLVGIRDLGWRFWRRLRDDRGGLTGGWRLFDRRGRCGRLIGFRLLGCGALKGASKLEASGGAGRGVIRTGGLNGRRGGRRRR